jgi:hypothetical protein
MGQSVAEKGQGGMEMDAHRNPSSEGFIRWERFEEQIG